MTTIHDVTTLPDLDEPCPDCTGPEADAVRHEIGQAWWAWYAEERKAYTAFVNNPTRLNSWSAHEQWLCSDIYRTLLARQPETPCKNGCIECDYIGRRPTEAGQQVLAFLAVHGQKG
jgi:hypothetical protein